MDEVIATDVMFMAFAGRAPAFFCALFQARHRVALRCATLGLTLGLTQQQVTHEKYPAWLKLQTKKARPTKNQGFRIKKEPSKKRLEFKNALK